MTYRSEKGWLGVLAVVWVGLLVFRFATQSEPARTPLAFRSGPLAVERAEPKIAATIEVSAPSRPVAAATFHEPKNIFAFRHEVLEAPVHDRRRRDQNPTPAPLAEPMPVKVLPSSSAEELAVKRVLAEQEQAAQRWQRETEQAVTRARQQQEQALQIARQQLAQYRYLGYLQQGGEAQAFLGKGPDIFIVRLGQVLEGRIRVKEIGQTTVQLLEASTSLEATLQLIKDNGNPS